jgi:hypothetical protein
LLLGFFHPKRHPQYALKITSTKQLVSRTIITIHKQLEAVKSEKSGQSLHTAKSFLSRLRRSISPSGKVLEPTPYKACSVGFGPAAEHRRRLNQILSQLDEQQRHWLATHDARWIQRGHDHH